MNIRFIKSNEKRKIIEQLEDQFGISDLPYLLIEVGKEKIRAFSGSLSKEEISEINEIASIESLGVYAIKKEREFPLRLSIDAIHLLKDQISKNILEISKEDLQKWIRGHDLEISTEPGVYIIKYQEDLIGCGVSNGKRIFNYIPKERRIKTPLPKIESKEHTRFLDAQDSNLDIIF